MMKNIWSKILFFCTLILVSNSAFSQQDTLFVPCEFKTQMFFRFDKSRVDHDYLDNQRILNELVTVVSQRGGGSYRLHSDCFTIVPRRSIYLQHKPFTQESIIH